MATDATVIALDDSQIGDVLATDGVLQSIEFIDPPSRFGSGMFRLVDRDSSGFERAIHCENLDCTMAAPKSNTALIAGNYPMLGRASIPFTQLIATAVPAGASFELTVA
jgi:hypothetical protein